MGIKQLVTSKAKNHERLTYVYLIIYSVIKKQINKLARLIE